MIKPDLIECLACPDCASPSLEVGAGQVACPACGAAYPLENGIPIFTTPPGSMIPFDVFERGPDMGTAWRRANWKYLQGAAASLPPEAVILDVGAGRGDFAAIFKGRRYLALDVYPYSEVDLAVDLTRSIPFREECLDAVILANVLEHVQDPASLLTAICRLLRPGGQAFTTIPFLLKIHQAPHDFSRFTRYGLAELASRAGLQVAYLEGYYDPAFLLNEALLNMERYALKGRPRPRRAAGRAALTGIRLLAGLAGAAAGQGKPAPPDAEESPAPVGYHVTFSKPQAAGGSR